MNEFEKQVFNSLSEKEQEKIAGGGDINSGDNLTEEQCDELRNAVKTKNPKVSDLILQEPSLILKYGGPVPRIADNKEQKSVLQPLNPVATEET